MIEHADISYINDAYSQLSDKPDIIHEPKLKELVNRTIESLDQGKIRVASLSDEKEDSWVVHEWVKKSILLYFRLAKMKTASAGEMEYWDKIPLKSGYADKHIRVVPPAVARYGSYIEQGVVLMPSYVNIGAYIATGSMVDTWATVGSCAQIGKNVHLSGGVGIGGVLEPPQAKPVIVEEHAFLGSRAIVVEGVHIGKGAVLGSGVILTASTKIIDVTGAEEKIIKGQIPQNSVVIPGTTSKKFNAGTYQIGCALIIGKRKESTDKKTSLNEALREFSISV